MGGNSDLWHLAGPLQGLPTEFHLLSLAQHSQGWSHSQQLPVPQTTLYFPIPLFPIPGTPLAPPPPPNSSLQVQLKCHVHVAPSLCLEPGGISPSEELYATML